jgi:dienelactone hydrolase
MRIQPIDMMKRFLAAGLLLAAASAGAVATEEVEIPLSVQKFFGESHYKLAATEYRPEGEGPFPLVVINHGSPRSAADRASFTAKYKAQSEALAGKGFVVINPLRRGYGKSDGPWAEDYFSCTNPNYFEAGLETAKDIAAAIEYAKSKPYIDAKRIVLVGQSAGGFGVLALASLRPEGVLGVVNFAGGRGSRAPNDVCNPGRLVDAFARYAGTTQVPMLWFYSENDGYFGPELAQRLFQAYRDKGVDVKFIGLPPFGKDGHSYFSAASKIGEWMPEFENFFSRIQPTQGKQ